MTSNATGPGKVYVYEKPASGWVTTNTFAAELTATGGLAGDAFGLTQIVNNDGSVIDLGACVTQTTIHGQGAIFEYHRPSSGWATTANFDSKFIANNPRQGDNLGFSVSSSGGAVVGARSRFRIRSPGKAPLTSSAREINSAFQCWIR